MPAFAFLLMLLAPQSAPPQPPAPRVKPYTVDAISPPRAFFDSRENPVVYLDSRMLYTESGIPVAYLDGNSVYRFNGKHLGWFRDRNVYDQDGNLVVIGSPYQRPPYQNKTAPPAREPQEPAPTMPPLKSSWSSRSAQEFFTGLMRILP